MPTLQFKGKSVIWNHHLSVPYHTLEEDKNLSFQAEKGEGNLIIEGDNLLALKALLPQYSGKVKCIYIDPPYNTGNESWVYNDNVNSPLINDWIGKEVGVDDLTRHDKWLCMMVPRLKLLRDLLSDEGVIFISIDDNEQHHLRQVGDEVFGEENFVTNIIWQKKFSPQNDAKYFSDMHDFIVCYAKKKINGSAGGWIRNLLPRTTEMAERYSNPDDDPRGPWTSSDMTVKTYSKEYDYPIKTPSGRVAHPPKGRCWFSGKEAITGLIKDNRVWFGESGGNVPRLKTFLSEVQEGLVPVTIWFHEEVGHNQEAKQELKELFGGESAFDSPKPVSLIKRVLQLATSKDSVVLDSYAGSGTTMHAVMDLNEDDGGNRKCILVQMAEATDKEPRKNICKDITQERIRRAIKKNEYKSGFRYFRVGEAVDAETMLSGKLPTFSQLAKYVYYLCTGSHVQSEIPFTGDEKKIDERSYFVGSTSNERIYLVYDKDYDKLTHLALNLDLAKTFLKESPGKKIIVYAPACFLDEEYMAEKRIEFVSVPYNLFTKSLNR